MGMGRGIPALPDMTRCWIKRLNSEVEPPPRLRQQGGCAMFFSCRSQPLPSLTIAHTRLRRTSMSVVKCLL
jgi:hypothetical protein